MEAIVYLSPVTCELLFNFNCRDKNPLLIDLEPEVPLTAKANSWFEKVRGFRSIAIFSCYICSIVLVCKNSRRFGRMCSRV